MAEMARLAKRRRITTRITIGVLMLSLGIATGSAISTLTDADAATQQQINRYIRSEGGIPPCTHEDGSGQAATCVWWAKIQGNGDGHSYLAVPDGADKDNDDEIIYITGPDAVRY